MPPLMHVRPEITAWLAAHHIDLDPELPIAPSTVRAQWDAARGVLHLGWWQHQLCPQCGRDDPARLSLITPGGNWQHECGYWWGPTEVEIRIPLGFSEEQTTELLDASLIALTESTQGTGRG